MKRKNSIDDRIRWAEYDKKIAADLAKNKDDDKDFDLCRKHIIGCLEFLNPIFDYLIKDICESNNLTIGSKYHFPFKKIPINGETLSILPDEIKQYFNILSSKWRSETETLPNSKIKYRTLYHLHLLVNSHKHNNLSKIKLVNRGDKLYESPMFTVMVQQASSLESQGMVINSHLGNGKNIGTIFFHDDGLSDKEKLEDEEMEALHFCTHAIAGIRILVNDIYNKFT
jgi:hypothetical protein